MTKKLNLACPHCGHDLDPKFVKRLAGRIVGSVTGKRKAHSPEVARQAALARWSKQPADNITQRAKDKIATEEVASAAGRQTGGTPPAPPAAASRGAP